MAKTRLQFLAYIIQDFKRDDKDTEIYQAYNDTLRHLCNLAPFENLKFQSWIPTQIGVEDYPLPATSPNVKCHVIHPVRCIESSSSSSRGYGMNKLSKEAYSERYPNPNASPTTEIVKGQPTDYCIYSDSILVGPLPDKSTYIIELDWAKQRTTQDYDADLQELGEDWEEVIKFGVLFRLFKGIGLDEEAAAYLNLYRDQELGYPRLIEKEREQTEKMGTVKFNAL